MKRFLSVTFLLLCTGFTVAAAACSLHSTPETTMTSVDYPVNGPAPTDILSDAVQDRPVPPGSTICGATVIPRALSDQLASYPDLWAMQDKNGNYLVSYTDLSQPSDVILARYSPSCQLLQEKHLGGSDYDSLLSMDYRAGKGIILFGYTQSTNGPFASSNPGRYLALLDEVTFDPIFVQRDVADFRLQEPYAWTDGGVACVIHQYPEPQNAPSYFLVYLDTSGRQTWKKPLGRDPVHSLAALQDGRFVLISGAPEETVLFVLNANGQQLSARPISSSGQLIPTTDGGFFLTYLHQIKTLPQPAYLSSIWIDTATVCMKFDSSLELVFRKSYDTNKDTIQRDLVAPQPDGIVYYE